MVQICCTKQLLLVVRGIDGMLGRGSFSCCGSKLDYFGWDLFLVPHISRTLSWFFVYLHLIHKAGMSSYCVCSFSKFIDEN